MAPTTSAPLSSRPSAGAGVFETILIYEDRPIELEAHLARLTASTRELYDADPPPARDLVLKSSRGGGIGRLRLSVEPVPDSGLKATVIVAPFEPRNVFPTREFATDLVLVTVDRGYGKHKWVDRDMLTRAEAAAGPGRAPVLVSADETVFEGSRANVFAVGPEGIVTPPLDGSILPGIARSGVIAVAEELGLPCRETRLTVADLLRADEVFLTGSLRGVEPVRRVEDQAIEPDGPVTAALGEGLKRRWFDRRMAPTAE